MSSAKKKPASDGVQVRIVAVTPEMAEQWLGRNHHNRRFRQTVVDSYARDMASGAWKLNGEAVKFADDARQTLLDGQHRLRAVVQSGVTVDMLVIEGLAPDAQDTMDAGAKRTAADVLGLAGEPHPVAVAGIARRVLLWERSGHRSMTTAGHSTTHHEIQSTLHTFPDIRAAAEFSVRAGRCTDLTAVILGFCYWALNRVHPVHAEVFFDGLVTGANLGRNDPVLVLRDKLSEARKSARATPDYMLVAFVFKAWNASRKGQSISLLRFSSNETFPTPK